MPAQKIKAVYGNLLPSRATKLVAMATFLDKVHQMFSHVNFFIDGVNATFRVTIRPPDVE